MNTLLTDFGATYADRAMPLVRITSSLLTIGRGAAGALIAGTYQLWQLGLLAGFAILSLLVYLVMKHLIVDIVTRAETDPARISHHPWGEPVLRPVRVPIPRYSAIDVAVTLRTARWS